MAEWHPIARSPIVAGDGVLVDCSLLPKTLVHARHGSDQGVAMGSAYRAGDGTLVVGTAPGQWLRIGDGAGPGGVDMTHFYAAFRLGGPGAATILRALCAIDIDALPDGAAFRAPVARVPTDVVRDDAGGQPSYLLLVDRSYAAYLWHALLDASR